MAENFEPVTAQRAGKLSMYSILIMLLIVVCTNALSLYYYHKHFALKITALDAKGYLDERKMLYIKGKLSEQELMESVDIIDRSVKRVDKNTAVFLGDAVVRNVDKIKIE